MRKTYDVYHSEAYHLKRIRSLDEFYEEQETMSVININGAYIAYSEMIEYGRKPLLKRDDLVLIGTFYEDEMDIKIVKITDYLEAFKESQMDYLGDIY